MAFRYEGTELPLFEQAVRWRKYWSGFAEQYLGREVLEVGAGIGSVTRILYRPGSRWLALEPDESLCGILLERTQVLTGVQVRTAMTTGASAPESFDTVLYIDVLEHIQDDVEELDRAWRLLKPGGHLLVLAPAHAFLFSAFDVAVGHHRRYSKKSLLKIGPPGAQVVLARYLDSFGMFASLANRLVLRKSAPTEKDVRFWDKVLIPISQFVDARIGFTIGKSLLIVWTKTPAAES